MTQTIAMDAAGKKEIYDICVVYGEWSISAQKEIAIQS
jgi:hypothetical protein